MNWLLYLYHWLNSIRRPRIAERSARMFLTQATSDLIQKAIDSRDASHAKDQSEKEAAATALLAQQSDDVAKADALKASQQALLDAHEAIDALTAELSLEQAAPPAQTVENPTTSTTPTT